VNFALGDSFSIDPQFTLGVSHQAIDETSGTSEDKTADGIVSVNLFVPLLVHPARHLFVGFGPSVYHEVSHKVTSPDPLVPTVQNRETTLPRNVPRSRHALLDPDHRPGREGRASR
jgi:hypothetical protein